MERWGQDSRKEAVITGIDAIVPKDHLLRKIEKVMDYEWIYEHMKIGRSLTGCYDCHISFPLQNHNEQERRLL